MSSCGQYIKAYEGILSTLHTREAFVESGEEDYTVDFFSETRKNLFELFAEAIRVLEDRESKKFKRQCEELEEKFYDGESPC